ncbi:MAG: glycosyltransferase [Lachnospiraceae bacterium]|nr:glycosyltransferase [Lachnospiraceae bacterium]
MKLVSVVVLSYRSAETIIETLDSIKNQTYQNIELIVTDDCSPDNSVEVAKDWIERNQGSLRALKLVTAKQNTGIPGNINRALKQASGEYVKLIAADDYMAPEAIKEYVDFCEKNPKTIPIAKVHLFSEKETAFPEVQQYCSRCYEFAQIQDYKKQYHMLLKQNCIAAPSGSFYPMQVIRECGGYDEHYRWFEDYPMNLKVMHKGYRCGLIDKELVFYRMSSGSITASSQLRLKKTEMKFFFRQKFWYMLGAGMGWEAVKQSRSWIKVLFMRENYERKVSGKEICKR